MANQLGGLAKKVSYIQQHKAEVDGALILDAGGKADGVVLSTGQGLNPAIADPGTGVAIPVTQSGVVDLTVGSAGAETNTLAIPSFEGQSLHISAKAVGTGTRAITAASAINVAGNTHMTFSAVGQNIMLRAVTIASALAWRVVGNDSVGLS